MAGSRKLIVEVIGDARSFEKAMKKASKAASGFAGHLHKTFTGGKLKSLAKAGGLGGLFAGGSLIGGGIAFGTSSYKAAADFEATLSKIQGLAGQSQKQVKEWGEELIRMGPALGKTPQELAEALYFIASSGVPASKAISVLAESSKAAAAGLGDAEVVADAVTSVMNAYASSGMTAARATDVLVATVREGKGEADQFAGTIGNVAAFASKLNVPFEQVGAALAAMTQLGTDPRIASIQLQAFFSSLLKVTPKAEKAAKSVGLNFDHLRDTLSKQGLLAALNEVKRAFGGNIKAMAEAFPNIRALRALLALTANDGGKVAGVFRRMGVSAGSSRKAFAAYAATSKFHMEELHASVQALKIAFGQGLAPVVAKAADALTKRFADPAFVARVRKLGFLVGTKLYNAFIAVKNWIVANWPTILKIMRTTYSIISKTVNVLQKVGEATGDVTHGRSLKHVFYGHGNHGDVGGPSASPGPGPHRGVRAGDVYLNGQKVGKHVLSHNQRAASRGSRQTRGRNGGNSLAFGG